MKIRANGLDFEVQDSGPGPGPRERPAVLLIMGLGMQLIAWPMELVQSLLGAGYRVICFDNRDVGLSQHLPALGQPNVLWAGFKYKLHLTPNAPYSLRDMAADALGVLDALGVARAHVLGVSMGGMIAQRVALAAPLRVLSLTSIMSSSGARELPPPRPEVLRALMGRPANASTEARLAHYVRVFQIIGSHPDLALPEPVLRAQVLRSLERDCDPAGIVRQMLAVMADTERAAELWRIDAPTLVLHGKADPLLPYAHAQDTAQRIAGAQLIGIDGLGHDLPPQPVQQMLYALLAHFQAAQARASA